MFDSIASLNTDQLRVKEKCEVIRNEMCDIYLSYDNINQENKDYTLIQINSILDIQKEINNSFDQIRILIEQINESLNEMDNLRKSFNLK